MTLLYLFFCLYACISGVKDAILYAKNGAETFTWNEHILFNAERFSVLFLVGFATLFVDLNTLGTELLMIACTLSFSFFHNGFYYETARQINRPDYRFWSNSKTSTAKFEITWFLRTNMFIASILIIIFSIIYT